MSLRFPLLLCVAFFPCLSLHAEREADRLGPPPKYSDQDYDPLPDNYAEIAKQYVASKIDIRYGAYIRLVPGPLKAAYPVEIDGIMVYRPCWSLLLKANVRNESGEYRGEQVFVLYFYKDRVVGTMSGSPPP